MSRLGTRFASKVGSARKRAGGTTSTIKKGGPVENPDVLAIIEEERRIQGITPRSFTQQEIQERCLFAMANEGARLVAEGVALRPSDVDVVLLYGYGFPRHRGGPMMAADQAGLLAVKNALTGWQAEETALLGAVATV